MEQSNGMVVDVIEINKKELQLYSQPLRIISNDL